MATKQGTFACTNPLDEWRKRSSFDVGALRNLLEGEEIARFKRVVWDTLARDPLFVDPQEELTVQQTRALTLKRIKRIYEYNFLPEEEFMTHPTKNFAFQAAIQSFDSSLLAMFVLNSEVRFG